MKIKMYCDGKRTELKNLEFSTFLMLEASKKGYPTAIAFKNN